MKVRIIKDRFGGMGWRAEPGVLHLGGVGTAGVASLSFALPEEWDGMAVTLHIEQEGGTLPQPVLLNESREVTIDRRFTAARQGLWMLLAQSADGYTAMSCPAKYDCYETIELSGTVEDVDPSVYAQFVALVQQAVNTAMNEGADAKAAAKTAKAAAASAASARGAANETLDACTAATQAANRAANLAPKKEERRLLMRLLREAAYQTKTADTLLDTLSRVWSEVPVRAVMLTRDSLTLYAGERTALGVRISPENATEQTVLWESSNEEVATVADGVITARAPGGTRITARADGCSADCAVLVRPAVKSVSLSDDAVTLTVGGTAALDAAADPEGPVEWASSDEDVAEVKDGVVTARGPGAAAILAASGGKYAFCMVRVQDAEVQVEAVTLSRTTLKLRPGEKAALTATVSPENADQTVVWYSAAPETACVTGGEVTAICTGTTEIAAIAGGVKAACNVEVAEDGLRAASILLSAGTLELTEGKTATLTATVLPTSIPQSSIVWTSSNEEAAVVDSAVVAGPVAGSGVRVDKTLAVSGAAADSKAVGDRMILLEGYAGGYLGLWTITLAPEGWKDCTDLPHYPHKYTAALRAAREVTVPSAVPALDSLSTAIAAGMATVCETKDGTITFWAEDVPEGEIQMQVILVGPTTEQQASNTALLGRGVLGRMILGTGG